MSTEISVDIAGDIVVDIEVDTRSIVGRHSVDTRWWGWGCLATRNRLELNHEEVRYVRMIGLQLFVM